VDSEKLQSRVVSADNSDEGSTLECSPIVGPAYKINVTKEEFKTTALLDHDSQVSIVRQQMLPDKNGWSITTCAAKNIPLKTQPVGATHQRLGALAVVVLNVLVETTGKTCAIPCCGVENLKIVECCLEQMPWLSMGFVLPIQMVPLLNLPQKISLKE